MIIAIFYKTEINMKYDKFRVFFIPNLYLKMNYDNYFCIRIGHEEFTSNSVFFLNEK